jgi:hypothetical protein
MKARINPTLILTCVLFTALLAVNAAGAAPTARPPTQAAAAVVVPAVLTVRINEVLPIPPSGGHDWVELLRVRSAYTLYQPIAGKRATNLEAAAQPPNSQSTTPQSTDSSLSGWQLGDGDGHFYTLPAALQPIPLGGRVLVCFNGLGPAADDYDFSDGVAVLHTGIGLVDILDNDADQVALYASISHNSQTLRSFMAYGGPPTGQAATDAVTAGLWPPGGG